MRKSTLPLLVVATVIAGLAVWGFIEGRKELSREREREKPVTVPSRVAVTENGTEVVLDEQAQKLADIGVSFLAETSRQNEADALATVLTPRELTELRNRLVAAMAQAGKAAAELAASRSEYDRLKLLHGDDRNISDRALQSAEAAWRANAAASQAAQATLDAVRKESRQTWGPVLAETVTGNTALFQRLERQEQVLLRISVMADMPLSKPPDTASVLGYDGVLRRAELLSRSPQADPRIQGPAFFYTAPSDGLLPGSTVTAHLAVGASESGVTIPASAVLSWQGKAWFYIENAPGRFARHELDGAVPVSDGWFVPHLHAMRVVVRGAQVLLSEELRGQIRNQDND